MANFLKSSNDKTVKITKVHYICAYKCNESRQQMFKALYHDKALSNQQLTFTTCRGGGRQEGSFNSARIILSFASDF